LHALSRTVNEGIYAIGISLDGAALQMSLQRARVVRHPVPAHITVTCFVSQEHVAYLLRIVHANVGKATHMTQTSKETTKKPSVAPNHQ
jgi:hypothetical protein